jgi:hypothetical protein
MTGENGSMVKAEEEVSAIDAEAVCIQDPLLSKVEFPLHVTLYPLGFPLKLSSNSPAVLEAANASWGRFTQKFERPPLELRLGVTTSGGITDLPPVPIMRMQPGLLVSIADASNYFIVDIKAGRSFGWITQITAECHQYLRYYILDAAVSLMIQAVRAAYLHAACVRVFERGVLLCGDSMAGKSTLAYAGARAGWTFVCDDGSHLLLDRRDRLIVGNCHQLRLRSSAVEFFPELEGRPLTPRANRNPSIEVPTAELPGIITADSAFAEYLVFLNRHWTGSPELVPLPQPSVPSWLKRSLTITALNSETAQDDVLRRLFDAQVFELRYKDLNWAIDRLNTLAQTGL